MFDKYNQIKKSLHNDSMDKREKDNVSNISNNLQINSSLIGNLNEIESQKVSPNYQSGLYIEGVNK